MALADETKGTILTTAGPTAYPSNWRPAGAPPPDTPVNTEAIALAIDAFIAALSDDELTALLQRTRNGGQPSQYGQAPTQQPTQCGR